MKSIALPKISRTHIAIALVAVLIVRIISCDGDEYAALVAIASDQAETPAPEAEKKAEPPVARSPLDRLKDSAGAGNLKHQLLLAVKYSTSDGVAKDQAEASRWYLLAAKSGDPHAMYEVSMRYRNAHGLDRSEKEANVWRQRAASAGIAEAQYEMAHLYGEVTPRGAVIAQHKNNDPGDSSRQLVAWLTRAAEAGYAPAKHELALVRLFGIAKGGADKAGYLLPLPTVTASAIQLLTENAEAGYWQSQHVLAELYQSGYADIKANPAESNKWWQQLEAQTDAEVLASIGRRYFAGEGIPYSAGANKWKGKALSQAETNRVAFEWFARAAAQGHANALWQLAVMSYSGLGTTRNIKSAVEFHQKAAELGQVEAMYTLGAAHAEGSAVPKDHARSIHWLNKAIAHEDVYGRNPIRPQAQNALGSLYENGHGVDSDVVIAHALYSLAAVGGDQKANDNLSRVAKLLKPEQLIEAESLSRDWRPGTPIGRRVTNATS